MDISELDDMPKPLILQLSARLLGPFAVRMRAERNTYRSQYEQAAENLARCRSELDDARNACKRMRENSHPAVWRMVTPEAGNVIYIEDAKEAQRFRDMDGREVRGMVFVDDPK